MADLAFVLFFLGPLLFVPAGIVVLVRARTVPGSVTGGALLTVGGAWAYGIWQYAECDEVPEPCGPPGWVDTIAEVALFGGAAVVALCCVALVLRRARRSRPAR